MIVSRFRRTMTLLAIAWYLPFVLTLDFHHNHGFPQPPLSHSAIHSSSPVVHGDDAAEICPVLRVSLVHGIFLARPSQVFSQSTFIELSQPCFCWENLTHHSSARAPPALS